MPRRRACALALAALGHLVLLAPRLPGGPAYSAPWAASAPRHRPAVRSCGHSARWAAGNQGATAVDERLVGVWRYSGGAYEIRQADGRAFFHENQLVGELHPDGEWLVAELPPAGKIQLKLDGEGTRVLSSFRAADSGAWGETITAIPEWTSLAQKTKEAERILDDLEFEGAAASGGVVVVVDGRQRPKSLRLSPEAAVSKDLGPLIVEAHAEAVGKSLDGQTQQLRELYAAHFDGRDSMAREDAS